MDDQFEDIEFLEGRERFDDEEFPTESSEYQEQIERQVESILKTYDKLSGLDTEPGFPLLLRDQHKQFLLNSISRFPQSFSKLDASRAWICYWILHSLALIGVRTEEKTKEAVVKMLESCHNPNDGGFGGGPHQYGHIAPTFAAINSYVLVGSPSIWAKIDKEAIRKFLYRLRVGDGSFSVHEGGESDLRAIYCCVSVAKILNIQTPDLFDGTIEWILRCQTYEGGFGGEPGHEAHGGYAYCGVAALYLLNGLHMCDLKALMRWTVNRQMKFEGGFQGRTNKLVDSCYSFWQGATVAITQLGLFQNNEKMKDNKDWMFDKRLVQEYVLMCCQDPHGGLTDKPQVYKDAYHTCYGLSGLSIAQSSTDDIVGDPRRNEVKQVHPAFNLPVKQLSDAMQYFYGAA